MSQMRWLWLPFLGPLWLALFVAQAIAAAFGARRTDDADPHAGGGA